jgi:hypothetical protein
MEAGKASQQDSLSLAREPEVVLNDRKKTSIIASILGEQELGEEELDAINAIHFQRGQKPLQRPAFQGNFSHSRASTNQTGTSGAGSF